MDFRTLIVDATIVLSLVFIAYVLIKSGGRFVGDLRTELEVSRATKRQLETRRRILELVGKFGKHEIEAIVFECWLRDFLRSHESPARLRYGNADAHRLQQIRQEILKQHQETLHKTRMELEQMSKDKVLELVDLYAKEWTARGVDPYDRMMEVIAAAGLSVNR